MHRDLTKFYFDNTIVFMAGNPLSNKGGPGKLEENAKGEGPQTF